MNREAIVAALDEQIINLTKARDLLNGSDPEVIRAKNYPKLVGKSVIAVKPTRHVSAEGRARIAAAQKKRWATHKRNAA